MENRKTEYLKNMIWIAAPIAAQNLVNFGVNMMDTLMLGQLGELPLAASSLANQVFFIATLAVYGIGGGMRNRSIRSWHTPIGRPWHLPC